MKKLVAKICTFYLNFFLHTLANSESATPEILLGGVVRMGLQTDLCFCIRYTAMYKIWEVPAAQDCYDGKTVYISWLWDGCNYQYP